MPWTGKGRAWRWGALALASLLGATGAFLAALYLSIWLHEPVPQEATVVADNSFRSLAAAVLGAVLGPALVLTWRTTQRRRSRRRGLDQVK